MSSAEIAMESYNQLYGSGYTETNVLYNSSHPAIQVAKSYTMLSAPLSKSTGWFMPTAGQCYAILKSYGFPSTGWTIPCGEEITNTQPVNIAINNALSNAANGTGFTYSVLNSSDGIRTSSESNAASTVTVWGGNRDVSGLGYIGFGSLQKTESTLRKVRPFLAF